MHFEKLLTKSTKLTVFVDSINHYLSLTIIFNRDAADAITYNHGSLNKLRNKMDNKQQLNAFLEAVKPTQTLWALQDKESEDWVVLDSLQFEETDVMPLWSSKALAEVHCVDEWQDYVASEITLADWFEFWVDDLLADNVVIGINWGEPAGDAEVDLAELTQALTEIEAL